MSVLKPAFHFASLGRHINPNTILKSEISEESLISLMAGLDSEESEEVSLQLYLPTVRWTPLQVSKFTLCLCGHV